MKNKKTLQVILLFLMFFIGLYICSYVDTTYSKKGIVTKIENNIVTVRDSKNHEWQFTGLNFCVGDEVKLIMDNNNSTNNIFDDKIKERKKIKK